MTAPAAAEPHMRAIGAALVAAGLSVGVGEAPSTDPPHVVVYADPGLTEGSLGRPYDTVVITVQITAVGVGAEQAVQQADLARAVLLTVPAPAVPGRYIHPLWVLDAQPVRRDDQVRPALFVATAQYRMRSDPA